MTSNVPKEVVGLTAEAKALRDKILALQTNLDGVLDNLAKKSEPLLEPLRKETEKLLAEKEKLQEEKHKINASIDLCIVALKKKGGDKDDCRCAWNNAV